MLKLTKLRLSSLLGIIKFDPYDDFFKTMLDDSTSLEYCLIKATELIAHLRQDQTIGDKVQDVVCINRIMIIALHKVHTSDAK